MRRYRGNSTIISTFGKYNNDPYGSYRANVNTGTNVSEVRITNGVMYINGSQATATGLAHTQTTPTNTLYLFCRNTSAEAKRNSNFRFSRFEITKNNELVRDFIPVQRKSDNVLGLYDLVNDVFYTNDGTGTFTAGPVIYENGGINKVIYNNQVLIDITDTTATINDVAEGKVFYLADGTRAVGVRTT